MEKKNDYKESDEATLNTDVKNKNDNKRKKRSHFAMQLKILRMSTHTTQDDLAEGLGVAKNTIYYWESGQREPSFEMVERIANFFDVSPTFLLGWDKTEDDGLSIMPILRMKYTKISKKTISGKVGDHTYYSLVSASTGKESVISKESLQAINEILRDCTPVLVDKFKFTGDEETYSKGMQSILDNPSFLNLVNDITYTSTDKDRRNS